MNIRDSIFRYSPPCVKRKVGLAVGNVSLLECGLLSLSWSSHASLFSMKSLVIWMFLLFFTIKIFLQVIVPRKSRIFIWFFASWNSHDKWHLAQRKTWFQSFSHLCVTGRTMRNHCMFILTLFFGLFLWHCLFQLVDFYWVEPSTCAQILFIDCGGFVCVKKAMMWWNCIKL